MQATHIVGGRISYECLGSDQYEISLAIYRDCINGAANAPFDNPAYIAVYDQFGQLVTNLALPFMGDDTLTTNFSDPCLVILEEVCVHTTTYQGTITLPFLAGGYTLAYQRCCRNETIDNIINPVATGATYPIELTESAMLRCNSSPTFLQYPPIYICADLPLVFDHSAVDAEGDSLVYRLCNPFAGGTLTDPQPIPASPPGYDTIVWRSPTYSRNNMLGTGMPLSINSQTGLMTATPGTIGQFVVGVCVEEYDRVTGELLSVTLRDFQYNVNLCGEPTAAFFVPDAQCDDLDVTIINQSENAGTYRWYFDWPNLTPTSTADADTFNFVFPDTGNYTITLIADPLTQCADTFSRTIYLQDNSLTADFSVDVFDCDITSVVELADLSFDSESPPVDWSWVLTYPGNMLTSTDQNPAFSVPLGVSGTVELTVTSQNGCVRSLTLPFESGLENPVSYLISDANVCLGESVGLNPNTPSEIPFTYVWSPAEFLDDPNAINPIATVTTDTEFTVTITPSINVCEIVKEVTVHVVPLPVLDFDIDLGCDGVTVNFDNNSLNADDYFWDFGDPNTESDTSSLDNPTYAYPGLGTYTVTLVTGPNTLCPDTLTREITLNMVEVSANFEVEYTSCATDMLTTQFTDLSFTNLGTITGWFWQLSDGQSSTDQNPVFTFTSSQTITVILTISTSTGCNSMVTRDIEITLVENDDQFPDNFTACIGDTTQLLPGGNPDYVYQWSPTTGIDDPTSPSPSFFPQTTTTYTVVVSHIGVDTCTTTEEIEVIVNSPINLQISGDGPNCEPNATLTATTDVATTIVWTNSTTGDTLGFGTEITIPVSGLTSITVIAEDDFGCSEEMSVRVIGGPVDVAIPDTVAVCFDDELLISVSNLDTNDVLTYAWTPVDAFEAGTANTANPNVIEQIGEQTLYVIIENQYGCTYMDSVITAVVDPNISLSFTSEVECNGATVAFTNTSTNAFGYIWYFGDGGISYQENPSHTYPNAGTYNVTLSIVYDVDCVVDFTAPVTVQDPQIIAAFDFDIVECTSNQAVIQFFDTSTNTFNNTIDWDWDFSNGDSSDVQNPIITVTESGELIVSLTIFTANNCFASITDTIDVQIVTLELADTVVLCQGDTTILNPSGNPDYTYSWSPATGLSATDVASPQAFPTETTTYTVSVQTLGTDTCEVVEMITVFVPADINLDLGPDVTTCGEDVTITANAGVDVTVEWLSSQDGPLPTGPSVTVNPFRGDTIIATATDAFGCMDMDTIVITDNGVDINTIPSGTITACQGVDTTITVVNLDDLDELTYSWTPLENIVAGADSATVTIVVLDGTVTFTGIVSNQHGCADTVNVTVTVAPFEYDLADTVFVCPNTPAGLNPDGNPSYTYQWSPADGLDDPTSFNPIFSGDMNTLYSVTVSDDSNGFICEIEQEVQVILYPDLNLVTTGDTSLCEISEVTLTATTDVPATIEWYQDDMLIDTGSPITVTPIEGVNRYTAIAIDENTMCADTSIVVVSVKIINDGLPADTVNVCSGVPTPINPDFNPEYTYIWSPETNLDLSNPSNPIVTTAEDMTYMVTITDPEFGCELTRTVEVIVAELMNPVGSPDITICETMPVTLTATSDVPGALFTWYKLPDTNTPIGTGAEITDTPTGATLYLLVAENALGCTETDTVVINSFQINATLTPDLVICEPLTMTTLEVTNNDPEQELTYNWTGSVTPNDGAIVTADIDLGENLFSVVVTNQFGCTETLNTSVTVIDLAGTLSITAEPDTILLNDASEIIVTGCDDCDFSWIVPSGTIDPATGPVITAFPDVPGSNIYEVDVDLLGCNTTLSVEVFVINAICDPDHVFIPNAFTPNNDGDNDVLRVRTFFEDEVEEMELMIYNRWGEEIFRTQNIYDYWNGTYNDEALPPDSYGFYLRVVCPNGEELIQKGNITLLR
ncbi:MAG: hypothetical protein DHS20C18_25380 [Saprospiraceae bacterium]|nr:MAG: hypothetical protein DHS20C18_25380 [Saprospiraceae bacterium]